MKLWVFYEHQGSASALVDDLQGFGHDIHCSPLRAFPASESEDLTEVDAILLEACCYLTYGDSLLKRFSSDPDSAVPRTILLFSDAPNPRLATSAMLAGADPYFHVIGAGAALAARLSAVGHEGRRTRQDAHFQETEARYQRIFAEEGQTATFLLGRLVDQDRLLDPALRYWHHASGAGGENLLLAMRTPSGGLHLLLAEGACHSLATVANALPLAPTFYRMTEKGFGLDAIVRELNLKVRQFFAGTRSIPTILVSISFREGFVEIWNGGFQEPLLVGVSEGALSRPKEIHPPLGTLDMAALHAGVERFSFEHPGGVLLYSPGLEALLPADPARGLHAYLQDRFSDRHVFSGFDPLVAELDRQAGHAELNAGLSLLAVTTDSACLLPMGDDSLAADSDSFGAWAVRFRLGPQEIRSIDVVPMILGLTGQFALPPGKNGELFVVLSEIYNNAVDHGLLGLDSCLKLGPEGMGRYWEERSRRLSRLGQGEIMLHLEVIPDISCPVLHISCRDSGPGFDHADLMGADGNLHELPYGRGLGLVRSLCSRVEFNQKGNEISALLPLPEVIKKAA